MTHVSGTDVHGSCCGPVNYLKGSVIMDRSADAILPEISPSGSLQPFIPSLAPSPLVPFTNNTVPKLSGLFCIFYLIEFPKPLESKVQKFFR